MTSTAVRARRAQSMQGRAGASTASSEPPSLFDAQAAREDGIARADEHANEAWKARAYEAVLAIASAWPTFTSDDVWQYLEGSNVSTHNPAALGPVIQRAAKAGVIVKTGHTRKSRFARNHRDITVWERA